MKKLKTALITVSLFYSVAAHSMGQQVILDSKKKAHAFAKRGMYYSALPYLLSYLEVEDRIDKRTKKDIFRIVLKTGTLAFETMGVDDLLRKKSIPLRYVAAMKLIKMGNLKRAKEVLKDFPKTHRFSLEAYYSLGAILSHANDRSAVEALNTCVETADLLKGKTKSDKLKRYYTLVQETCTIYKARNSFSIKNYAKAEKEFDNIPKKSYLWPKTLLERAWTNYHLADYNRSLGLLVTYKSPLLKSYYFPEGSYLEALSFYKLCLWEDALSVIESYHKLYHPKAVQLKKILSRNRNSKNFFYNLMLGKTSEDDSKNPFIRNLVTQIKKSIKYNVDHLDILKSKRELEILRERKYKKIYQNELVEQINWRVESLNYFIKKEMFNFVNQMNRFSRELLKLRLEIISKHKQLVYGNKTLVADRGRGDASNVKRKVTEQFYDFHGEFWADELGSYSFGLKSNCELVDKKGRE